MTVVVQFSQDLLVVMVVLKLSQDLVNLLVVMMMLQLSKDVMVILQLPNALLLFTSDLHHHHFPPSHLTFTRYNRVHYRLIYSKCDGGRGPE